MSYYIYIYISRSLSPSALFPCSSLSLPSALFPCSSLSLPSALFHRATTATQSAEQQQHHPSAATEHRQPAKEKMKFGPKMLPRWSRVFSHIYKVNNLQRRREIRGDFFGSSFRNYVKVAAIVDPSETNSTETHSTINPEVNLKKMFWSKSCSLALAIDSPHRVEDPSYEGIRRFILRLMLFYSKQSQFIRWSHVIYRRVTYQVDRPAIYDG